MVVGTLKKGLKGALPVLITFFIGFFTIALFSSKTSLSDSYVNIFYNYLIENCNQIVIINIINFLILSLGAILLSIFTIQQEVVDKSNYLPAFLYLFFGGIILDNQLIHPSFIANIFILLALIYVTETYREENALPFIFNSAFFTFIAIFFYINYTFFIFLFFICLAVLRPFSWREWVIGLLGLIAPIFIYACISYLTNSSYNNFFSYLWNLLSYLQKPLISEYFYPLFFYLLILIFLTIGKHLTKGLGSKIKTQKNLGIIYWFLFLSLVNFFSKNNNYYFPLIASVIPISILLSDYFYNIKQLKVANTLFFLLLASSSFLFLMKLSVL